MEAEALSASPRARRALGSVIPLRRIRSRNAVISALLALGIAPVEADRLGVVKFPYKGRMVAAPYEWFARCQGSETDTASLYESVLVLWSRDDIANTEDREFADAVLDATVPNWPRKACVPSASRTSSPAPSPP